MNTYLQKQATKQTNYYTRKNTFRKEATWNCIQSCLSPA